MRLVVAMLAIAACSESRELSQDCVDCVPSLHERGISEPESDAFHGKLLARTNWDFGTCAKCHGEDFSGGASEVSCLTCHQEGPTACTTCHRDESVSHATHRAAQVECINCHRVPERWDAPGHIVDDSAPAEVTLAAGGAFDGGRCSNVYCHGDTLAAGGGANTKPRWNEPAIGGCMNCHATPPPSHQRNDCATCHPTSAPHIDGVVQIGRTNDCSGCHGSASSPAPPVDLAGNVFTTALGVGAHQAHLQAPSGLRGPISCETCHAVPPALTAVGHLDAAPADVNAALGWDRTAQTCTTWCHGTAQPKWTSHGEVVCGSCHGVPPAGAPHTPAMNLASCANCHAGQHMNGVVDGL